MSQAIIGTALSAADYAADAKPAAIIESLMSQIESRISGLFDISQGVDVAINRLLNPQPEGINKALETPAPQTIEGRLSNAVRLLDILQSKYSSQSERLDSAV